MMDTKSFIQDVVTEINDGDRVEGFDTELLVSGILDSLGIITLMGRIEEEYGIEIDADDVIPDNFGTIDAIADLVEKYLA